MYGIETGSEADENRDIFATSPMFPALSRYVVVEYCLLGCHISHSKTSASVQDEVYFIVAAGHWYHSSISYL
jgi:hypothetical protein